MRSPVQMGPPSAPSAPSAPRWAVGVLLLGALLGVAAAVTGMLAAGSSVTSLDDHVAVVNGVPIQAERYHRLLAAMAADKQEPLTDGDRRLVLDRLIDEELLVQRAVELGFVGSDARVRGELTDAVVSTIVAQAAAPSPSEDQLAEFYRDNRDLFATPGRLRIRRLIVSAEPLRSREQARERVDAALARLDRGDSFTSVRDDLGDDQLLAVPDTLLPPGKLTEYIGPTAARTASELSVGEWSRPIRTASGFELVQVLERSPGTTISLADDRDAVVAAYRRRHDERALRDYLEELRGRADIEVRVEP